MRWMILVKGTASSEAGEMPPPKLFEAMADYHKALADAGALVAADGLRPTGDGWRIAWKGGEKLLTDGPFPDRDPVAGYTIIQTATEAEARGWASRYPNPSVGDGAIEVRRIYEMEDFADAPGLERFRELGLAQ